MNLLLSTLFCAVYLGVAAQSSAHSFNPIETRVESSGEFFIRRLQGSSDIEIRRASDLELDWKAPVPNDVPGYSEYRLSSDGSILVHIRPNYSVHSINDVCVEVFHKSGKRIDYLVKDLMDSLPKCENGEGVLSPFASTHEWIREIRMLHSKSLVVELISGMIGEVRLDFRHARVSEFEPKTGVDSTYAFAKDVRVSQVTLPAGMLIEDAIKVLSDGCEGINPSRMRIESEGLGKRMIAKDKKLDPEHYSLLFVLANIAEEAGADLIISRGLIKVRIDE